MQVLGIIESLEVLKTFITPHNQGKGATKCTKSHTLVMDSEVIKSETTPQDTPKPLLRTAH